MPIQVIEPQRLYRQIADQLRRAVVCGEFARGSRLPAERDLARLLGVSRPSLREALIALEIEGVVEVRTGSGIYVQDIPPAKADAAARGAEVSPEWGPLQLMKAREVVEGEVAALAARYAKKSELAVIARGLEQMRDEAAAGQQPRAGDERFHTAIADACGNEVLRDTVQIYWRSRYDPLFERLGDYFETPYSWHAAIKEHALVLEAIRSRDPGAARQAMHRHLQRARSRYAASWNQAREARL